MVCNEIMYQNNNECCHEKETCEIRIIPELDVSDKVDALVRRMPIDFHAIAKETGLRRGKICKSEVAGWGIYDGDDGVDFTCITAPDVGEDEELRIENNEWCVYQASVKHRKSELTG